MKKQRGYVELLAIIGLCVLMVLGLVGFTYIVESKQCQSRAELMRLESQYGLFIGCMVRVDDRWAPISYIRIVDGKIQIAGDGE